MPKLESKAVMQELESGSLWPVYALVGTESMKSSELLKRIRRAVLGPESAQISGFQSESRIDGSESNGDQVVEEAQSLAFGSNLKLVVVRDAHALKQPESIGVLFGARAAKDLLTSVVVLVMKDLDGRKKFSKTLVEKAAVVSCEEVAEADREAWVQYLAKRRGITVDAQAMSTLRALEPWSLGIIDLELEKLTLNAEGSADGVLLSAGSGPANADAFIQAFFRRDRSATLGQIEQIANRPEEALPLLGLMAWNVRMLALLASGASSQALKLSPFLVDRLRRLGTGWTLDELVALEARLSDLDFTLKQRPHVPTGEWADLVISFASGR